MLFSRAISLTSFTYKTWFVGFLTVTIVLFPLALCENPKVMEPLRARPFFIRFTVLAVSLVGLVNKNRLMASPAADINKLIILKKMVRLLGNCVPILLV